jgi:TIGR03009 family protein
MRRIVCGWTVGWGLVVGFVTPAAAQQGAAPGGAARAAAPANKARPKPDPKRMDAVLRAWETESQNTRTLYAQFQRKDFAADWETTTHYQGDAFLQSPNLAYLNFDKLDEATKKYAFNERIVCTPDRVYQFLAETKQVQVYDLARNQRQRALEEGPLPFLFNMKAEDAKKRYRMELLDENDAQCLIRIDPIQGIDKEAFSRAFIWLDKAQGTPKKIRLMDPANDKNFKEFDFKDVRRNVNIKLEYFKGLEQAQGVAAKGWSIIRHPAEGDATAAPAANRARPRAGDGTVLAPRADRKPAAPARR